MHEYFDRVALDKYVKIDRISKDKPIYIGNGPSKYKIVPIWEQICEKDAGTRREETEMC